MSEGRSPGRGKLPAVSGSPRLGTRLIRNRGIQVQTDLAAEGFGVRFYLACRLLDSLFGMVI